MKPIRTWILVADGARARIFINNGPGKGIEEMAGNVFEIEIPPSRDIVSDKPGRTFNSTGTQRHAIEPGINPHRERKRVFLAHVAHYLDKARRRGDFDRLVIVAPPPALGDLRGEMNPRLRQLVTSEIAHDLVEHPKSAVSKHLAKVLPI